MPRFDGFPTNREMQVDFTSMARNAYVAAVERQLESKVSPAYQDKPLDHFGLRFLRDNDTSDSASVVRSERLTVWPIDNEVAKDLEYNNLFKKNPEVVEYYGMIAQHLGQTSINDNLRFGRHIIPGGINAEYTAYLPGRTRHVSTFKERTQKQSLVAAQYFTEETLDYVKSDIFDKPSSVRRADYERGYSSEDPKYQMQHKFMLRFTPYLPLNGHEASEFLESYASVMEERLVSIDQRIAKMRSFILAPASILDEYEHNAAALRNAADRARSLLDKK